MISAYGQYYKIKEYIGARRYLLLSKKSPDLISEIDLLVVMMNPGGSTQIDNTEILNRVLGGFVKANPDKTQYQIMKIMNYLKVDNALIINLSDVINPNSGEFCKNICRLNYCDIDSHSIFSKDRVREVEMVKSITRNAKVIFACGVNYRLESLTNAAKATFNKKIIYGWKNIHSMYYHPYPRRKVSQDRWITELMQQIA